MKSASQHRAVWAVLQPYSRWLLLSAALLLLYVLQFYMPWFNLAPWQSRPQFKLFSGLLLCGYLARMWLLFFFREEQRSKRAKTEYGQHSLIGMMGPLLFLIHARSFGSGFFLLLSLVFFANLATGLLLKLGVRWVPTWFKAMCIFLHVCLAAGLPILVLFHVYLVYAFK